MQAPAVQLENSTVPFSDYPQLFSDYFANREIIIKVVPVDLDGDFEVTCQDFRVTSPDQFFDYLKTELEFWNEKDPKGKLNSIVQQNRLKTAIDSFKTAMNNPNSSSVRSYLQNSTNAIANGVLSRHSLLAGFLLNYIDATPAFIQGLKYGLEKNKTSSPRNVDEIHGVLAALEYLNDRQAWHCAVSEEVERLLAGIKTANESYSSLNEKYAGSFFEQEQRLQSITEQTNAHFQSLAEQTDAQNKKALSRLADLEALYEEKLKLEAPAEYWAEMEKNYAKSGMRWLEASVVVSILIILLLFFFGFSLLPSDLGLEENWTYIFKLSAMFAVITSVAVYVLRLFVKMATSSFHLSRDAKERNRLSYFYLALIEKKAITDKERAIVLNSLFSRADTGLLKGDSSPVMSGNVTDLVGNLTKSK